VNPPKDVQKAKVEILTIKLPVRKVTSIGASTLESSTVAGYQSGVPFEQFAMTG